MNLFGNDDPVSHASGEGLVDWAAVATAAKTATSAGDLTLDEEEKRGYARDVRDARERLRAVGEVEFDLPETVQVQNRHHWIDANIRTFERVMAPIEQRGADILPGLTRVTNTGTMAVLLIYLSKHVLGQYDPLLLADSEADHELYFVRPNIRRTARALSVDYPRFRRWIAFHEVAHAAEFGAAPWLSEYLESRMRESVESIGEGDLSPIAVSELQTVMTAVEGYAELLMDRAFDEDYTDLREKLDQRRCGGGPVSKAVRQLLGLGLKRRQYERGSAFFEAVADAEGVATASVVWDHPDNLPTDEELENPDHWLARVA